MMGLLYLFVVAWFCLLVIYVAVMYLRGKDATSPTPTHPASWAPPADPETLAFFAEYEDEFEQYPDVTEN